MSKLAAFRRGQVTWSLYFRGRSRPLANILIPLERQLIALMARWKARVEFLLSVIELLFLSLAVEALQGKMCQNSLPSGGGRSLGAKISGGRGRPLPIY